MFGWLGRKRRQIGDIGEAFATKTLKEAGYRIVERNFTCREGEIDIIARDGDNLVMVEVKLRTCGQFGAPEEAVDSRKLRKISRAALYYLTAHHLEGVNVRLDVICVEDDGSGHLRARHIINAAELSEG